MTAHEHPAGGSDAPEEAAFDLARRVATLARLDLSNEECAVLGPQFAAILAQFEGLAALDVEDVEPMTGASLLADVRRADEPRPSALAPRIVERAPDPCDGFFGVPKTVARPGDGGQG